MLYILPITCLVLLKEEVKEESEFNDFKIEIMDEDINNYSQLDDNLTADFTEPTDTETTFVSSL